MKSPIGNQAVEQMMTSPVISFALTTTVKEAVYILLTRRISGAPILDQAGRLVTVVSEADLMKFSALGGLHNPISSFQDKLVPTASVVTVKATDTFKDVFKQLLTNPVRRVIVVDAVGRVQGIVSRANILKAFLRSEGYELPD